MPTTRERQSASPQHAEDGEQRWRGWGRAGVARGSVDFFADACNGGGRRSRERGDGAEHQPKSPSERRRVMKASLIKLITLYLFTAGRSIVALMRVLGAIAKREEDLSEVAEHVEKTIKFARKTRELER